MKKLIFIVYVFLCLSCSNLSPDNIIEAFINYPNPFSYKSDGTTYNVKLKNNNEIDEAYVDIFYKDGIFACRLYLQIDENNKNEASTKWQGIDENGNYLPKSVYLSKLTVKDINGIIENQEIKTLIN